MLYTKNEKIFNASYICLTVVVSGFTFFNKNEWIVCCNDTATHN